MFADAMDKDLSLLWINQCQWEVSNQGRFGAAICYKAGGATTKNTTVRTSYSCGTFGKLQLKFVCDDEKLSNVA